MVKTIISIIILIVFTACNSETIEYNLKKIEVSFFVDESVYYQTDYGEPPQIAVWIEHPDSGFYKSVWVTRRAGKNEWKGKVECLVALPYWSLRKGNENKPSVSKKLLDAISGATVAEGEIKTYTMLPDSTLWNVFIEVNTSGDYNSYFRYMSDNHIPDTEGNGQPSIIYRGSVNLVNSEIKTPEIIGRTNQHFISDSLFTDLGKITSASKLIKDIKIKILNN